MVEKNSSCPTTIEDVLTTMKEMYEEAIRTGGRSKVHSVIRSQKLINCLHNFIKGKLIRLGVDSSNIIPPHGKTSPELPMTGFYKTKMQDISVLPQEPKEEKVENGVLKGDKDKVGRAVMDKSITINIRSQMSSLAKNFDTLYERTFAEALNLHLRSQKLTMGEVYMVPFQAYDPDIMDDNQIGWKEYLPEYYIRAFQGINNRQSIDGDNAKYERVCLLIIDFREDPPKLIESTEPFLDEGIMSEDMAARSDFENLHLEDFVSDILDIYENRHGSIQMLETSWNKKIEDFN